MFARAVLGEGMSEKTVVVGEDVLAGLRTSEVGVG